MQAVATKSVASRRLRVSVHARDPVRRAWLRDLLRACGHDVVDGTGTADVAVADRDCAPIDRPQVVVLGVADADHAGVLPGEARADQIDAAVRAVAAGLTVRTASSESGGFGAMRESRLIVLLTPRELEVLDAIVEGLPNKSIAQRLDISPHTVKFHVEAVFRKLGVRTRTEAAAKAWQYRSGTVEL
jgi:DNA-binding CsgD family transcriptional regulator